MVKKGMTFVFLLAACLVCLGGLAGPGVLGASTVTLEEGQEYYADFKGLEYFEDTADTLTIDAVSDPDFEGFRRVGTATPSFGFCRNPVWIRVSIHNQSAREKWLIETMNVFIDYAEFYDPAGQTVLTSDRSRPVSERLYQSKYPTFPLEISPGEVRTVYLKYYSRDTLYLPLTIKSPPARQGEDLFQHLLVGFIFGIALLTLISNGYTFLVTGIKAYFFYSFYLVFFVFWLFATSGFGYLYLWPQHPGFNAYSAVFFGYCFASSLCLFTIAFLNLRIRHRRLFLSICAVLGMALLLLAAIPLTSLHLQAQLLNLLSLAVAPLFIFTAAYSLRKGYRPARYYLTSYLIWWIFMALWISRNVGVLDENFLTHYAVYYGSVLQIVLFSFALSNRMAASQRERDEAQKSLIEHQKTTLENQRRMVQSYSRFVPAQFLRILGRKVIMEVELGDHVEKGLTIMFVDVRSFTSLAESMKPTETFNFLNSYLKRIGPVIRAHGGFIDKYIGDGIMALFPEDPNNAVRASLEIFEALILYNEHRSRSHYQPIDISVGIHRGETILGTIGERDRIETTVISDAVNLASRLEGLNRHYGSTLIVSEDLYQDLDQDIRRNFRRMDRVRVKGKNDSIYIYQYLGDRETPNSSSAAIARYEEALEWYVRGDIGAAEAIFRELAAADGADRAVSLFVERCARLHRKGLPEDWQGIEDFLSKTF